jgi:AcrR family transcriptional regulator
MGTSARPYRQTARAAATQKLRQRVVLAFHDLLLSRWMDEITLDEAATSAGTTRQTVIRLFGGKEGLLEEVIEIVCSKALPRLTLPHNASRQTIVKSLIEHYEAAGDITVRLLAQEERHPALRPPLERGRRGHRAWVEDRFGASLSGTSHRERQRQIARLIVATDVYTWKLLRRDLGNSKDEVRALVAGLIDSITRDDTA